VLKVPLNLNQSVSFYSQAKAKCWLFVFLQVQCLLRSNNVKGPMYRAAIAIAEGMHARRCDIASELVTKPLLGPLLRCLDSTGMLKSFLLVSVLCQKPPAQ